MAVGEARLRGLRDGSGADARSARRYLDKEHVIHARLLVGRVVCAAGAALLAWNWGLASFGGLYGLGAALGATLAYAVLAEAATTFSRRHAGGLALPMLRRLRVLELVTAPFAAPLVWVGSAVHRLFPPLPEQDPEHVTEKDVGHIIEQGEELGSITQDHAEMLRKVLEFHETMARDIMVPRTKMVAIALDTPLDEVLQLVLEKGHSRFPVYRERADQIAGVLYAKDMFPVVREDGSSAQDIPLSQMMRTPVFFVAETHKIGSLLREMQSRRIHLAVVVDEFGGTSGIITLEDILEEIVGEIIDEHDDAAAPVVTVDTGHYEVDATVSVFHLEEMLGVALHEKGAEHESLSGLLVERFGNKVPPAGECIEVAGLDMTVLEADGRRVMRVDIRSSKPSAPAAE